MSEMNNVLKLSGGEIDVSRGAKGSPVPIAFATIDLGHDMSPEPKVVLVSLKLVSPGAGRSVSIDMTPDAARRLAHLILENAPAPVASAEFEAFLEILHGHDD